MISTPSEGEAPTPVEALRTELKLTGSEMARRIGVSTGHMGDLRSGRRKPSLPIAAKLDALAGEPRFVPDVFARKMREGT